MKSGKSQFQETLPIELKLRLLEAELGRLEADSEWLNQRRQEILEEVRYYRKLLFKARRRTMIRRVK